MQLRTLFHPNRFNGCTNARFDWVCFQHNPARPLSLLVQEDAAGAARLLLKEPGQQQPAAAAPLPDSVRGRILFWERWCNAAMEREWEIDAATALYGLEAYGLSVAAQLAALYPDRPVDYCGLPVHDEVRAFRYADENRARIRAGQCPPLPLHDTLNRYVKNLYAARGRSSVTPVYLFTYDADWCYTDAYFERSDCEHRWGGSEEAVDIEAALGFPAWMTDYMRMLELFCGDTFWELEQPLPSASPVPLWGPSPLIHDCLYDAFAVDVARVLNVPVQGREYVTGEEVLALCGTP